MTGYYITIGYNGGSKVSARADYWDELKKSARQVCDDPKAIITEARRLGAPESCETGCCALETYADNYRDPFGAHGHPVSIHEDGYTPDDCESRYVAQHASTDGPIKYHVRRAFVRLLIESMHRKEIEVNVRVS